MGRTLGGVGLLLAIAALGHGAASAQDERKAEAKDKFVAAGELAGRLARVETDQKLIAVEVKIPYLNGRNIAYQSKNLELLLADDVKVRTANPPTEFDEKGRIRHPNAKRLKELRGPGKLPGYKADLDNLKVDQVVQVFLKRAREKPHTRPAPKETLAESKPVVSLILILQEPIKQ